MRNNSKLLPRLIMIIKHLITSLILVAMTACGNPPEPNSAPQKTQGTSDGGGGIITGSTKEEVREAIVYVRDILAKHYRNVDISNEYFSIHSHGYKKIPEVKIVIELGRNIFRLQYDFWSDYIFENKFNENPGLKELEAKAKKLFDQLGDNLTNEEYHKISDEYDAVSNKIRRLEKEYKLKYGFSRDKTSSKYTHSTKLFGKFLKKIELNILEEGPCSSKHKDDVDASVSEDTHRASICFSLENLSRLPKNTLHEIIAGLWFHELAHMTGSTEDAAQKIEHMMVKVYNNKILHRLQNSNIKLDQAEFAESKLQLDVEWFPQDLESYHVVKGSLSEDYETILRQAYTRLADMRHYSTQFRFHFQDAVIDTNIAKNNEQKNLVQAVTENLEVLQELIYQNEKLNMWTKEKQSSLTESYNNLSKAFRELYKQLTGDEVEKNK